jgi:response regulator RpfG family c-di-GMP phosphodiesterase
MNGAEPSPPKRPRYRSALIIDPDLTSIGSVRTDPALANREFDLSTGGRSAEMLLSDSSVRYSAIFLDAGVHSPTLLPMLHEIREKHPATPVYLLHSRSTPLTDREIRRLGVQECVKKPFTAQDLARRTQPPRASVTQPPPSVAAAPNWGTLVAQGAAGPGALDDSEYFPVLAEEFLSGKPSPYDAYVRVAPGQYVRVLNAKDNIEPERVLRFISLGATHLYLKKQPLHRCLTYCDLLAQTLAARGDASFEVRLLQLASQGEEISRLVRALGGRPLSPALLTLANGFLAQLAMLIRRAKKSQKELASEFLRNANAIEHSISVTFVAALLSTELGIESPAIWAQLGLAAFFHDIGLYELPEKQISLDTTGIAGGPAELLTPAELQKYQQHPIRSVELLSVNPLFEAATLQSVLQHHERRDGSGFPRRLSPDQITPLAEIIGISDEFIRLLKQQENDPEFKALEAMEAEVFNGFSFRTIKAFRAVFL